MESTFYGLPIYNLNKPGTPVARAAGRGDRDRPDASPGPASSDRGL